MERCLAIAKNGLGSTRPNPMVGCVIVVNGKIISEGYTSAYGGNHAEVNAITAVKDSALLKKATIYVTLEPCSHYGKTPPCSDLIIARKIPNVVIGCIDDNIQVAGKGIQKLKAAGVNVHVGVLEDKCKQLHKRFFTFHNKKRPYIILKWAETANGYIAPKTKTKKAPVWITNSYSKQLVHKWRMEEQSILVGTNTVREDNPSLTVRDWTGQHPIRIVLDRSNKLPKTAAVFNNEAKTKIIDNTLIDFEAFVAEQVSALLYKNNITSVIIEGGTKTLQTFIDEDVWDEARVFVGNTYFEDGVKAPVFPFKPESIRHIKTDVLKIYKND